MWWSLAVYLSLNGAPTSFIVLLPINHPLLQMSRTAAGFLLLRAPQLRGPPVLVVWWAGGGGLFLNKFILTLLGFGSQLAVVG
jgi:hypothetical protein